jgi:hypothetical protein
MVVPVVVPVVPVVVVAVAAAGFVAELLVVAEELVIALHHSVSCGTGAKCSIGLTSIRSSLMPSALRR